MVVHREVYANRRFRIGMSDFGGQPPHSKVVSWEPELPETRIVTIRTPCYVYVDILPNMKSIFSVPVVPVIPFGGEKNGVPYLWCVATPVDASIKLQKIRCNS